VLHDVIELARELLTEAAPLGIVPRAIGIGVAELTDPRGRIVSEATIRWKGMPIADRLQAALSLPTRVDADVRAAARAEAGLGAGRHWTSFLYISIGTGISAALVVDGEPYLGARGLTGTFASSRNLILSDRYELTSGPPLEACAAGPALAARYAAGCPGFAGTAREVIVLAEDGDRCAKEVVESSGRAVGAAIAHLVNVLDPEGIVIGGGLGSAEGSYRKALERGVRELVWSDLHRGLPLVSAGLGADAGWIGAALGALQKAE
jgi:glucokinase